MGWGVGVGGWVRLQEWGKSQHYDSTSSTSTSPCLHHLHIRFMLFVHNSFPITMSTYLLLSLLIGHDPQSILDTLLDCSLNYGRGRAEVNALYVFPSVLCPRLRNRWSLEGKRPRIS